MNGAKRTHLLVLAAFLLAPPAALEAQEVRIDVQADRVVGHVSRLLTGACIEDVNHEIYGGLYSQMIFGESFQEPPPSPSIKGFQVYGGRWTVRDGAVHVRGLVGPKLLADRAAF